MKPFLLTLFLLVGILSTGYTQTLEPMLDTTKRWTDLGLSSAKDLKAGYSSTYKLSGSEQINGQSYFKLYVSENDPEFKNWSLNGYMREAPDGKVYLKTLDQANEVLFYDINMEPGDSLAYQQDNWVVADSVAFHEFAGKTRKFIYCHASLFSSPEIIRIVEGIGSLDYGFLNIQYVGLVGGEWALLCFEQNDELLYHNPVNYGEGIIEDCFYDASGWPGDPFLSITKKWTDLEWVQVNNTSSWQTTAYKFGGDISLGGHVYKTLLKSQDSLYHNWETAGYLRMYYDKRLYFKETQESPDLLLYYGFSNSNYSIDYGGNGIAITGHEFKNYAGRYRWHAYGHTFPKNRPDTIIEGIGSISSGFLGVLNAGLENKSSHLLCFTENEQLLYHYPFSIPGYGIIEDCYFNNTDIEPVIARNEVFQILPNPIESKGRIKADENLKFPVLLEIFSLSGTKVMKVEIQKTEQEISFCTLLPGMYMCRLKMNDKILFSKVLVK